METAKIKKKLLKRAFQISCLDGSEKLSKQIFLELMHGASVKDVEAVLEYLSNPKISLYKISGNDVCVNKARLCCSHCKHVICADGWHIAQNICGKTNVILAKNISDAGICGSFAPTYLAEVC